ncbi:heat-inducible transcriptional repressor HrcA [Mycoplasmopsis felifaucium]|uniref:Heat-inducible transcription repressor HrcA n=1 Tax=Mycoplasmopsis felifaucium TaxID=35768 RepID=A0ABZ2RT24_9BACT
MDNLDFNEIHDSDEKLILKCTVEAYIETGYPVSSQLLIEKYNIKFSSAKIRSLMNKLELKGFLEKRHTSSGRVPSTKGYNYYAHYLTKDDISSLKNKMKDLFAKRRVSIDQTVKEVANLLAETIGVTLVTTESNENATLVMLQLVPINDFQGTVVIVNSYGEAITKLITIDPDVVTMNDLRIAMRIFKERLINVPLVKLCEAAQALRPILAESIKNYESVLENIASQIFEFHFESKNNVYGKDNIILADDIARTDLLKILDTIENKSIWESIEADLSEDENIKIAICNDHSTFITRKIKNAKFKEISLVGTNRMNYAKGISALELFEELVKNDKNIKE